MIRSLLGAGLIGAVAFGATGCGRKGPLETAPPAVSEGPVQPDKAKPSNRPFILDPLLR